MESSKAVLLLVLMSLVLSSTGLTPFNHHIQPEYVFNSTDRSSSGERVRGMRDIRDADFVLGGLFPVHTDIDGSQCGQLRTLGGIDRVEAMLFAIDCVNSDPWLLPNLTLGYDIRDTCFVEQIGLDEAADLILTGTQSGVETACPAEQIGNNRTHPLTIGLIGAASSSVSIAIAGLSRLFNMPQISYSSTSAILGNRERYTYFYRTVPSDSMEVHAIIDLIEHFGWTFISTIYSRNSYGQSGIDDLHMLASERGICIDLDEGIEEAFNQSEYHELAEKLSESTANVVVFYATQQFVRRFFNELVKVTDRHFTWIATSAWVQSAKDLPQEQLAIVSGMFGIIQSFDPVQSFQNYYSNLTLAANQRNPWFPEYLMQNCMEDQCYNQTFIDSQQEYSIPLVIDAVYTYAHALEKYLNSSCDLPLIWNRTTLSCQGQKAYLNGTGLLQYIGGVDFVSPISGNHIVFDSQGGVQGFYEITNFQVWTDQNQTIFQPIGTWNGSVSNSIQLQINTSAPVQHGISASGSPIVTGPVLSACGSCDSGQYLRKVADSCCGFCDKCLGQLFSNKSRATQCDNCSIYGEMWGENPTNGSSSCVKIPELYLQFSHPFSIVVSIGSIAGLLALPVAAILLGIHWKSPVIMASSRESVVLILIGAGCSFASSFIYLSPPSLAICTLQRMLLWFCFSLMYGALLIKVVRIARIFVFQKSSMKKLVCVNTHHQVILSLLLVAIQMIIVVFSVSLVHPQVVRTLRPNLVNPNALPEVVVTCQAEPLLGLIISVLYEAGLILITVVLGTLTFKSPANFNESKAISVSSYILLSIWTFFFVSYTFTETVQHLQNAFIALTNTLGAFAILGSIICPRLFIVLFWREKNSKLYSRRATEGDASSRDFSTVDTEMVTVTPRPSIEYNSWDHNLHKVCNGSTDAEMCNHQIETATQSNK